VLFVRRSIYSRVSDSEYELKIPFGDSVSTITYADNSYGTTAVVAGDFIKRYKVGQQVVAIPIEIRKKRQSRNVQRE
jgi:hypothetical protein